METPVGLSLHRFQGIIGDVIGQWTQGGVAMQSQVGCGGVASEDSIFGIGWRVVKIHATSFRCPMCGRAFASRRGLIQHARFHDDAFRTRMSDLMRGRHLSVEQRERISRAQKGHVVSDETRRRMSVAAIRVSCDPEVSRKRSEAAKRRWARVRDALSTGGGHGADVAVASADGSSATERSASLHTN